jgi:hypothetical protein
MKRLQHSTKRRATRLGHQLSPFVYLGETIGAAECLDDRCRMGVTICTQSGYQKEPAVGAAVMFRCVGKPNRRTLRYAPRPEPADTAAAGATRE